MLNQALITSLPFSEKIIYHREHLNLNSLPWLAKRIRYLNRRNRFLWKIQDAQRNSTLKPLIHFDSKDVIIFSDLDEFPSENAINQGINYLHEPNTAKLNPHAYSCDQTFFYYNLDNASSNEKFYGSVITTLDSFRSYLPHKFRSSKNALNHLSNGGWHFSYFMDNQKILNKIQAIGDVENLSHFKNISAIDIQNKINKNIDLFDRKIQLSKNARQHIPEHLLKLLNKYLPLSSQ